METGGVALTPKKIYYFPMFSNISNIFLPQLFFLPPILFVLWKILGVLNEINKNLSNKDSRDSKDSQNLAKVKKDKSEQFCPFCFATIPISALQCKFCDKNLNVSWPIN